MKYIKRSIEDIVESSADTFKAVLIPKVVKPVLKTC